MKKLAAIMITFIFLASATDAVPLAGYWSAEYKCPRCKMKMERKGDCPCHKKNRTARAIIHDPCGDNEGDFHISFDRIQGVVAFEAFMPAAFANTSIVLSHNFHSGITTDIPQPPPRQ